MIQKKPISIENALIFGESDRFYQIVDHIDDATADQEDQDYELRLQNSEIVGLHVINIQYDNVPCSMIMFRNWTNNFKFQFQKNQSQLQEMITATVSHEMRTPINAIMTQLESLKIILKGQKEALKMTDIIKNSAQLLLYLVNDMLDVYMLKNGKFQKIEEQVIVRKLMKTVFDMFYEQMVAKNLQFNIIHTTDMPDMIVSDDRRLKQVLINLVSNALKFTS